jgi:type VI secretion system secreted protein Hcp
MDKTSPLFFAESCVGQGKTAKIHMAQTSSTGIETYMEYTLTNTLISGYNVMSNGDRPVEAISLNFTKVEMKYTTWNEQHQPEGSVPAGYDIATGVRL